MRWTLRASLLLVTLVTACPGGSSDGDGANCDTAAENLTKVCGTAFAGEDFRALCEIESRPIVPQSTRDCVAAMNECSEEAAEKCGIRSVTFTCRVDDDCPKPFLCDQAQGDCARCLEDDDCAASRGCLSGLCYDRDSDYYKAFKPLFGTDGGTPRDAGR